MPNFDYIRGLKSLRKVRKGWFDGDGELVDEKLINCLLDWLPVAISEGLSTPLIYPTLIGGVMLEWSGLLESNSSKLRINNVVSADFTPTTLLKNVNCIGYIRGNEDKLKVRNVWLAKKFDVSKSTGRKQFKNFVEVFVYYPPNHLNKI